MNIGFDFDGTITKNPLLFKILIDALVIANQNVFIITGTRKKDSGRFYNELIEEYKITSVKEENILLKEDERPDNVEDSSKWKQEKLDKLKIRCYFENRYETALSLKEFGTIFYIL